MAKTPANKLRNGRSHLLRDLVLPACHRERSQFEPLILAQAVVTRLLVPFPGAGSASGDTGTKPRRCRLSAYCKAHRFLPAGRHRACFTFRCVQTNCCHSRSGSQQSSGRPGFFCRPSQPRETARCTSGIHHCVPFRSVAAQHRRFQRHCNMKTSFRCDWTAKPSLCVVNRRESVKERLMHTADKPCRNFWHLASFSKPRTGR